MRLILLLRAAVVTADGQLLVSTGAVAAVATFLRDALHLVPQPRIQVTHAVTIAAPVEQVWPWLAQIGQDRGGFYSYEWLENLAGCEMRNAEAESVPR